MADDILLKEIGKRINLKRKELNLTQEQLAEKMDVSIQMISNLEQGKKAIRPENLIKVCKALNISADYILLGVKSNQEIGAFYEKYSSLSPKKQNLIEALVNELI